jgi:transcriptional regulator
MKPKVKQPPVPKDRSETIRHELAACLNETELTAKELSGRVGIPEREVYGHLEHIRRSLSRDRSLSFNIIPAACVKCGFIFSKRDRLTSPGRCPVCKSESIDNPVFSIKARRT